MLGRWGKGLLVGWLLLPWMATAMVYARLPQRIVVRWGIAEEPVAWAAREHVWWGPVLVTGVALLLFWVVPAIDPWRHNLQAFRTYYLRASWAVLALATLTHGYLLLWNLGYQLSSTSFLSLVFAGVMALIAQALRHTRPNWFFGIRTPWTLASPWVWHQVHQRGATLLWPVVAAFLLGVVWAPLFWLAIGSLSLWAVFLVVYSYWLYRSQERRTSPTP